MADPIPLRSDREHLIAAARVMGRLDAAGPRELVRVSLQDTESLIIALLILGLCPIPPLQLVPPERLTIPRTKEY